MRNSEVVESGRALAMSQGSRDVVWCGTGVDREEKGFGTTWRWVVREKGEPLWMEFSSGPRKIYSAGQVCLCVSHRTEETHDS